MAKIFAVADSEVVSFDPYYFPEIKLEGKYDFITCSEVVEHLYQPGTEIQKLQSLIKSGGILGVMTQLYSEEIDFADWWYRRDPTHVCFFQRQTMEWIAREWFSRCEFYPKGVTLFT